MDLMATGISGLRSASLGIAAAANNVAKAGISDFREPAPSEGDGVDLAAEFISLMSQSTVYKANLKVIQTADQLLGSVLDMKS